MVKVFRVQVKLKMWKLRRQGNILVCLLMWLVCRWLCVQIVRKTLFWNMLKKGHFWLLMVFFLGLGIQITWVKCSFMRHLRHWQIIGLVIVLLDLLIFRFFQLESFRKKSVYDPNRDFYNILRILIYLYQR